MARNRGTGPPQVLAAQGAHGCSRSLGPFRLVQRRNPQNGRKPKRDTPALPMNQQVSNAGTAQDSGSRGISIQPWCETLVERYRGDSDVASLPDRIAVVRRSPPFPHCPVRREFGQETLRRLRCARVMAEAAAQASSSASGVATVGVAGSDVTVNPVASSVTTITVTASGADNSVATQQFQVTVLPANAAANSF